MSPRTAKRPARRLNLSDPVVAARLDATGIPPALASVFANLDVSVRLIERLHATGLDWAFVARLSHTQAVRSSEDVAALVTFANFGYDADQIEQWARLGSLDAGVRLHLRNVPFEVIASFPLTAEHGLGAFLRMLQSITETGIHVEDVLLWHTAGAITLTPPYLVDAVWVPWRAVAVNHLGMRSAALAAAAGLSVQEAVQVWADGEFDTEALRMLAEMRAVSF